MKFKDAAVVFVFILLFVAAIQFGIGDYFSVDFLVEKKQAFVSMGIVSVGVLLGIYAGASLLFLPIAFFSVFSGMLYGFLYGGIIAYIGSIINMTLGFLISRFVFYNLILNIKNRSPKLQGIFKKIESNSKSFIFYARLFF